MVVKITSQVERKKKYASLCKLIRNIDKTKYITKAVVNEIPGS